MSIASAFNDLELEVLPETIPAYYTSTPQSTESNTLAIPDSNDDPVDQATGSGPELGGVSSGATTYSSSGDIGTGVTDADTVNLTGMTESPMTASASGPNINGSGADGQQVSSRSYASAAVQAAATSISKVTSGLGASLASSFLAPRPTGTTTLQQTSQSGLGKWGNILLFFFVGAIIAMVIFDNG